MKYVSLFAGIGGFDLALNNLGFECVYANDFDEYCKITYDKNFSAHRTQNEESEGTVENGENQRYTKSQGIDATGRQSSQHSNDNSSRQKSTYYDYKRNGLDTRPIGEVSTSEIPDHDILVGGFPCQAFSIAGKRAGFADTRGTLFFDIARILKDKRPRYFLLENVKGLLSHEEGKTFQTILGVLSDLGYEYQWQVLNSKNFGVPQNRERVFIVGHLRGEPRPEVFPITGNSGEDTRRTGKEVAYTIDANYHKGTNTTQKSRRQLIMQINDPIHSNDRIYNPEGISPTLNTMQGGRRQPFIALTERRTAEAKKIRSLMMKKGKDWSPRRGKELVLRDDEIMNTLTAGQSKEHFMTDGVRIRRLTPLECERLQGFPDGWTEGVSNTQRYKQLGNAVTVNVVEYVAQFFKEVNQVE